MARLGWQVDGPDNAPVLVMGSSLGTTRDMWAPQIDTLARHFRVLRYDHRGHGQSEVVDGRYTIDDLGSDVLALLGAPEIQAERVHYAGVSLGGMIGMWLAIHAPERLDRLALVSTSAYLPPASAWVARADAVRHGGTEAIADAVVGRWFTPAFAAESPGVVATARAMLTGTSSVGYVGCCAAIETMDQRPGLSKIVSPTLVISATDDMAIPPEHGRTIADAVPGARFELIAGAHIANMESVSAVTELLMAHLGDAGRRPVSVSIDC